MDTPTLSQLQNYTTDHFTTAHPVIGSVAQQGDHVFGQLDTGLTGLGWEGDSAEQAMGSVGGQRKAVSTTNSHLYDVIAEIQTAAQTSGQLHSSVINFVQQVSSSYDVSDDFTVTPKPANDPPYVAQAKQAVAAQLTTQLGAQVSAFMTHQETTRAALSAHAGTLGGHSATERAAAPMGLRGGLPDWHIDHWDDPNHGHYDPNFPTPATPYEKAHHGSNFNDQVILDPSMTTSTGRSDEPRWLDQPPVKGDWPNPDGLLGTPGQPQPFLPKLQSDLTNPAVPAGPPLTQQTPNGSTNLLPPVRPLPGTAPSAYQTGASPPLPNPNPFRGLSPNTPGMPAMPPVPPGGTIQQGITDGVQHGWGQTNGYTGGGHVQMVDNTTENAVAPPDMPDSPHLPPIPPLEHPTQCSGVDWATHGMLFTTSALTALYGAATAETGVGVAIALLGAGGVWAQSDALGRCMQGEGW